MPLLIAALLRCHVIRGRYAYVAVDALLIFAFDTLRHITTPMPFSPPYAMLYFHAFRCRLRCFRRCADAMPLSCLR